MQVLYTHIHYIPQQVVICAGLLQVSNRYPCSPSRKSARNLREIVRMIAEVCMDNCGRLQLTAIDIEGHKVPQLEIYVRT